MAIEFHPYTLRSRGSLNAVSTRREFHGALIKVEDGIGCLHPWPEFGDAPVNEQLSILRQGDTSKVIERALRMAAVDGAARKRGVNLFADLEIPPCHYSWDQHQPMQAQLERVISEDWRAIKTKGWGHLDEVIHWLNALVTLASGSQLKLRIDFNSCLTQATFHDFLERLPAIVRERLDFIEDPYPYSPEHWNETRVKFGVRLALDKQLRGANAGFDVAVLKPGRREWREMTEGLPSDVRVVMTSAMDHAIGQSFAAYEAALAWKELGSRLDLCGLATQHLFEQDEFFARLGMKGDQLQVDREGTGLGFDEVIANLPWQSI
jgi:O-succinylbenzoate synthase